MSSHSRHSTMDATRWSCATARASPPAVHTRARCASSHCRSRTTMTLETTRLNLMPCSPAHILTLIEEPERFEQSAGFPADAGLRAMFASDDVSPAWLEA